MEHLRGQPCNAPSIDLGLTHARRSIAPLLLQRGRNTGSLGDGRSNEGPLEGFQA